MLVKYASNSLSEELVCRVYLITRLGQLLSSRALAVALSAALFASYHIYYGPLGMAHPFLMGLLFGCAFLWWRRFFPLFFAHVLCDIIPEVYPPI